jgi:hypothetical protein
MSSETSYDESYPASLFQKLGYFYCHTIPEGVSFSPFNETTEACSLPQAQVVPDSFAFETPPSVQEAQSVIEIWMAGIPTSAQPQNNKDSCESHINGLPYCVPPEEDYCKYPPHVLENMDNSQE